MKRRTVYALILACFLATAPQARPQTPASLSIILVPSERLALELRSRIVSGDSFEALAMQYSTDPSAARAGYWVAPGLEGLGVELKEALAELRPGTVSPVFRAGESFLLLKLATPEEDRWRSRQSAALTALQQGRFTEAIAFSKTAVEEAEEFGPDDVRLAESLNALVRAYVLTRNPDEGDLPARRSLAILERALGRSHRGILPALTNLADTAELSGRYVEAEQLYHRILAIRWGTPETAGRADALLEAFAEVLSLAYTRDPALETALAGYRRLIAEVPIEKNLYKVMRDGLLTVTLVGEAVSLMKHAVTLRPDSRQLRYELGELYEKSEKYQAALEVFEQAAHLASQSDTAMDRAQLGVIHEKIAQMNLQLVRFDDAIAALRRALSLNPDSSSAHLLLGALYQRRNEFDKAAAEYRHLLSVEPDLAAAHDGLAQVDLAAGRFDDAIREAERATAIDPWLQSSRYTLGMALLRSGRTEEGRNALEAYREKEQELERARSGEKEIAEASRNVSALLEENRLGDAVASLEKSIRRHPEAAMLHLKQGLIQSRMGEHKEAVVTFESMAGLHLDDFLVHRNLAREYALLGDSASSQRQRVLYLEQYDAALQSSTE